jgi:hypothetical protein
MTRISTFLVCCALLSAAVQLFANDISSGSGTVAETIYVESYVYVRLEEDDIWLAAAPIAVAVGDRVEYRAGSQMVQFHSTSLERTFDSILFVGSLEVASRAADNHAALGDPHAAQKNVTVSAPKPGEIAPLEAGTTIGEIQIRPVELADQQVSLRARVVKVSEDILGKNWITLQDGTGDEPNNKLIATSAEIAHIGDLVTVSGVLRTDVALGSGYTYKVLLEEAVFSQ